MLHTYSPFAAFHAGVGDTLYVSLGYRGIPPGNFSLAGTMMRLNKSALFINSDTDWYLGGIPGFAADSAELLRKVDATARAAGASRVEFLGSSMGGFGALLYGLEYGADRITALSPEVRLGLRSSRSGENLSRTEARQGSRRLERLWHGARPGTVRVLYGDADLVDCVGAAFTATLPHPEILCFPGFEHHFANQINASGELHHILFSPPEAQARGSVVATASRDDSLVLSPVGAGKLYRAAFHLGHDRPARALADLQALLSEAHVPTCAHHLRGKALSSLGRHEEAIEAFGAAWRARPRSLRFSKALARAYLKAGRPFEATMTLSWLADATPADPAIFEIQAHALRDSHRFAEAVAAARQALSSAPDRWQCHWGLGECLRVAGNFAEAASAYEAAARLNPKLQRRVEQIVGRLPPAPPPRRPPR